MRSESDLSGVYPVVERCDAIPRQFRLEALNPALITAYYFLPPARLRKETRLLPRTVSDYELEFIVESDGGSQEIDGVANRVKRGDVVFRRPGESTRGTMRYECICVIFSLNGLVPDEDAYPINNPKSIQSAFSNPWIENLPSVIETGDEDNLRALFDGIIRAFVNPSPFSPLSTKIHILEILHRCMNTLRIGDRHDERVGRSSVPVVSIPRGMRDRLEVARRWIRANVDKQFTVTTDAASEIGLSRAYFQKAFTRAYGVSPSEYAQSIRLDLAREILATTDMPIRAVALKCGFREEAHFYHFFRERTGMTPGAFRKRHCYSFS
jgi:AraC-like DNA-binding protein